MINRNDSAQEFAAEEFAPEHNLTPEQVDRLMKRARRLRAEAFQEALGALGEALHIAGEGSAKRAAAAPKLGRLPERHGERLGERLNDRPMSETAAIAAGRKRRMRA